MRALLYLFIAFLAMSSTSSAQTGQWTPKDIIHTEYLSSAVFSKDNSMIAWQKSKAVKKKDRFVRDIYLSRLHVLEDSLPLTLQLTTGEESNYSPLFSADGKSLYFLSSRDEGKKLWKLDLRGGEAQSVHEFEHGLSSLQWSDDSTLMLLSNEGPLLVDQRRKENKDNVVIVEDTVSWTRTQLYSFSLKEKKLKRHTLEDFPIRSYRVSRDGKWVVYSMQMSTHYASDANPDNTLVLLNLATGERSAILQGFQTPGNFQFAHDHRGFYFTTVRSSDPEWNGAGESELHYFDLNSRQIRQVDLAAKWGTTGAYFVHGGGVLVQLANGPTVTYANYQKSGDTWSKSNFDTGTYGENTWISTVSHDGNQLLFEHSTGGQLPRYFAGKRQDASIGTTQEIAKLNKSLVQKKKVRHEVMRWTGFGGDEVNGILYYPRDYEEGKRYPLMLSIHGGPSGVDQDRWRERWSTYPQLIAERGAFVLKPNYHGSSGHGQAFVESIKGHYYDLEIDDILRGLDDLDARGMIDMDQLGVMGWSNGAIIATMLTVRYPDMFKVACPGAGDVNWTSDYGTCRFGVSFDQSYFGGAPWDDVDGKVYNENYILKSPLFELEKVKTPTIIFHGSEDRAVPRDQGWEYYRALQQANKTPVRFLWFPGQPHGLGKITHQMRKMEEELAWIDRYLFGEEPKKNPAFKKDSPLARLQARDSLTSSLGLVGREYAGKLIPTVTHWKDSLCIAEFEVTNAQYAQFDPNHTFAANRSDFPVLVRIDQAKAYLKWLSDHTGSTYRLPSSKEGADLHKQAVKLASKENTLRYWAGYEINSRDARRLMAMQQGEAEKYLLRVGTFSAAKVGKAEIFDLGGNTAEFSADGTIYGFSATDFVDETASDSKTRSQKLGGLRVVLVEDK